MAVILILLTLKSTRKILTCPVTRCTILSDSNKRIKIHPLALLTCLLVCRAPVLVALALIELGMKYEDAVELIRE